MNKKKAGAVLVVLLTCLLNARAFAQGQEPKFNSNADEITKISKLVEEFRQDVIRKDGYAITKLLLNPNVLFHSIDNQESVDNARKLNAQFDGIGPSALDGFVALLATSKDKLEETFHNIEIRQDGDLGLVTFNYDFVSKRLRSARRDNTATPCGLAGAGRLRASADKTVLGFLYLANCKANGRIASR